MYRLLFQEMMEAFALHEVVAEDDGKAVDYRFIEVNREFERLTGMSRGQLVGRTLLEAFPDIEPSWVRRYGELARTGLPVRFEAYSKLLRKHLELSAFRVEERKLAVLFFDITDRRMASEALKESESRSRRLIETLSRSEATLAALVDEKDALLREVHHRVKNNLQVIVSLMNIERSRLIDDGHSDLALARMQDRVLSMAEVHDALYRSAAFAAADLSVALHSMADRLADTYDAAARGIAINIHSGEMLLPLDFAVPCCLALNELLTNALKHAFPTDWTGPRSIDLNIDVTENGRVAVSINDSGIGISLDHDGLEVHSDAGMGGLQLVRLLAEQIDGELSMTVENGTTARLLFALP
ncbi:MAG: histidine kinase dimerization/phosphoacceptor domain -containing protein [Treponemataceae bacterium]